MVGPIYVSDGTPGNFCYEAKQIVKELIVAKKQEKNPENIKILQRRLAEAEEQWRKMIEVKRDYERYVDMSKKNILKVTRPEDQEEMINYIHQTGA